MADGARLASAFVEVTAKTDKAKKAIGELFDDFDKDAEKRGKSAGDALNKGISKGAADAGKTITDELTKSGEQAGDAIADGVSKGAAKGAKDAVKSVTEELGKASQKVGDDAGKQVGDGLSRGISQGAKAAGQKVADELSQATKKVGEDAGNDFADGLSKGAARAADDVGKQVSEKMTAAAQRAADDVAQVVISPTVKPKVDTDAATSEAQSISQTLREKAGKALGDAVADVGLGDVGKKAGQGIGDAITDHLGSDLGIGQTLGDKMQEVINGIVGGTAAWKFAPKLMQGAEAFGPVAGSLALVPKAEDSLKNAPGIGDFAKKNLPDSDNFNWFKAPFRSAFGDIMHPSRFWKSNQYDNNGNFIGDSSPESLLPQPTSTDLMYDGVFGAGASGVRPKPTSTDRLYDSVFGDGASSKVGTSATEVAVSTPAATIAAGNVSLAGDISMPSQSVMIPSSFTDLFGSTGKSAVSAPGLAEARAGDRGVASISSALSSRASAADSLYSGGSDSLYIGKYAGGTDATGVARRDKNGKLIGPGTGTSDSILGVAPSGMPTALVSDGEGVVKGAAMQNGAGPVVAGMNAGMDPISAAAAADPAGFAQRTQGYIPAGAGASGQAGSSFASGLYQMGASAINGLIDQAAGVAAAGVGAMTFGAGGGAAGAAIGVGTQAAKRGIQYGAQLLGIATDSLAEDLLPFGVPRFLATDPTAFMPHLGIQPTAVTTGEKASLAQTPEAPQAPNLQPGGPVQPMQLPGAQPVAAPVQIAKPEGVPQVMAPVGAAPGPVAGLGLPVGAPAPKPVAAPPQKSGPQPEQQPAQQESLLDQFIPARGAMVFDSGGWLQPGGLAINRSSRPEPILNDQQWASLNAAVAAPASPPDPAANGGGPDFSVNLNGDVHVKDVDALMNEIDSRRRLQMMRFASRP